MIILRRLHLVSRLSATELHAKLDALYFILYSV